ncbi:RING finger protein 223 [Channa argus]|uniref:RING finger protein 223 n=1 Tax=Channa argus TaxID=215402 RepID=A0A6G1PYQ9_CHAAH|nr:RING finger protein 223 [Channa argus]KAK2901613.1 hypothetical protein Q8A73_011359 [Channa argus]
MNPYGNTSLNPRDVAPRGSEPGPALFSVPGPCDNSNNPNLSSLPSPPVIQTGQSSVLNSSPCEATSNKDGDQNLVPPPVLERSTLPLPASDFGFNLRSGTQTNLAPVSPLSLSPPPVPASTPNPYPAVDATPSFQVSVIIPPPYPSDSLPPPITSQCSEESCPDLECSICFSQFNNIFRCPKMLHCKHTFCLECLARINVKSAEPSTILCPLCRGLTPLPNLGLPKLTTDSTVLSYLPAAMQRVYSIRFIRNKGKLEVKRPSENQQRWGQRSFMSLRSMNRSLDVGLPSPAHRPRQGEASGVGGALFRLTGRPACRAFLLTSVVLMMVLLMGIIVFITFKNK